MATQELQQMIADYFKTQPVLKAWLFGSYSRGCYLGHYVQWFFWFFFVLGFFIFDAVLVTLVGKWLNWF